MSALVVSDGRKVATAHLAELTAQLTVWIGPSISRLPKRLSAEAQLLCCIEDRRIQLQKLDVIRRLASLLRKLAPSFAAELKLEIGPIADCLNEIEECLCSIGRS